MKTWDGNDLVGRWTITRKIDGVQAITDGNTWVSRANKPLYNIPKLMPGKYEIFRKNWETSVSLVRSQEPKEITKDDAYMLSPVLDNRLIIGGYFSPNADRIRLLMADTIDEGYEGLVLYPLEDQEKEPLKVKPKETHDVKVIGVQMGQGKHKGRMGALITDMGNVGTGFTDIVREQFAREPIVGKTIEVECMGLTPSGKFRHPRFLRVRFDK